ncbi:hypothetical protein [Caballeronia sp. 15715]|uniref:hypothetical protein n=1 Tax=unclassified Caballeronia TaxID=2646786 RepID=UPI0039E68777
MPLRFGRHWSAGPVNAFTLWKPEAVHVTQGADNIGTCNKTPHSYRKWCKSCGGHLFTEHRGMGLTDVSSNRSGDSTLVLPSEYLEIVIERK